MRIVGGTDGSGGGDGPMIVLLHGFGAPGTDLVPLWRAIDVRTKSGGARAADRVRYVFPEAPLDLGPAFGGGRAWWWVDVEARMRRGSWDPEEVPEGLHEARGKVVSLLEELRGSTAPLILGGFSQGAMLSLDVALSSDIPLAGLVFMSGTYIAKGEWDSALARGERRGLPVFMSHGRSDPLLPFATAERLRDILDRSGMSVDYHSFAGGHGIPPEVLSALSKFLTRALA